MRREKRRALTRVCVTQGVEVGIRVVQRAQFRRLALYFAVVASYTAGEAFWKPLQVVAYFVALMIMVDWTRGIERETDAYTQGWMEGRFDAVERIQTANSPEDWFEGMMTHDFVHVLGANVVVPDTPEGLEDGQ